MEIPTKEIVTGRKVFFIAPDTTLMPRSYLEDFFALGYECYYIEYDKREDFEKKVKAIISLFEDVLLFFNIDYPVPGVNWEELIKSVSIENNKKAFVGIYYAKRQSNDEKLFIEKKFMPLVGLGTGFVQLEYSKSKNIEILEETLWSNQAQGRRKTIRALCTQTCTFNCMYEGNRESGILQDISLSHFSIVTPKDKMPVKLYEKIKDIHFNIQGLLFTSDAVLMMERETASGRLCVFAFLNSVGGNGLEQRIKLLLIPTLYKLLSTNVNMVIEHEITLLKTKEKEEEEEKERLEDEARERGKAMLQAKEPEEKSEGEENSESKPEAEQETKQE